MAHDDEEELIEQETEEVSPTASSKNPLRGYLNIILRKWFIPATFAGAGFAAAAYLSGQDPSTYLGRFEILIEPVTSAEKLTDASVLTRSEGVPSDELLTLDYPTQLKILKSTVVLSKIVAGVQTTQPQIPEAALMQNLQKNLIVQRVQEGKSRFDFTKILQVSYEGNDPVLVETILKVAADQYLQYSLEERENSLKAGVGFIDEQIPILETQIQSLQEQQRTLQQRYNFINPSQQATNLNDAYQSNQQNIEKIDEQLEELRALKIKLETDLGISAAEAPIALNLSQNPDRQNLLKQLQELDTSIATQSSRFTPDSPILKNLSEKREILQASLDARTQEILQASPQTVSNNPNIFIFQDTSRVALLEQLILTETEITKSLSRRQVLTTHQNQLTINLDQFPRIAARYDEVARQLDLKKGLLDKLANQRETLRVEAAQQGVPWKIISTPELPRGPGGSPIAFPPDPKKKLMAGVGGGLILGLVLAIALEKSQDMFYSRSDLEFGLGYPVWGELPLPDLELEAVLSAEKIAKTEEAPPEDHNAIVAAQEVSGQEIYTQFYFEYDEQGIGSMAITAIDLESGQAAVIMQFARAAVNAGQTVLVIDTHLDHPEIHHHCREGCDRGLINVLNLDTDPQDLLTFIHEEDGLAILPVGPIDPSEPMRLQRWLTRLDPVLQTLTQQYDLVIYNAPLLSAPDTPFLLKRIEGFCLVVRLKHTSQSATHRALATVQKFKLPVLSRSAK
jgi:polysaccharide biosynthesis transport protein